MIGTFRRPVLDFSLIALAGVPSALDAEHALL